MTAHSSDFRPLSSAIAKLVTCITMVYGASMQTAIAEWPEYRGNQQRTSFKEQPLRSTHWQPKWNNTEFSAPKPAWPEPARGSLWQRLETIEPRVTDDRGYVPLIGKDRDGKSHVLIASSANDRLVCFSPASGQIEWQYTLRAPIRFAPSIRNGIAYLGADDGRVRAIDLQSGAVLWDRLCGPELPWIVGNGRLISSHPIRTSVVVHQDLVFANAGLYPSQGVYSVALNRTTGNVVWRKRINQSPQGYLLTDQSDRIVVPTGRSSPFVLHARTGRYLNDLRSPGGSFCMLTPDAVYTGPGNTPGANATAENRGWTIPFRGRSIAAGRGFIWIADGRNIHRYTSQKLLEQGAKAAPDWSIECQLDSALIVSGQDDNFYLFVAGEDEIRVFDALSGTLNTSLKVPGENGRIQNLAVSATGEQDTLLATTDRGHVFCWQGTNASSKDTFARKSPERFTEKADSGVVAELQPIIKRLASDAGLALILHDETGQYAKALAANSRLTIVSVVSDRTHCQQLRQTFFEQGVSGDRISVWHLPREQPLPFADGIFNLVLNVGKPVRSEAEQLKPLASGTGVLANVESNTVVIKPGLPGAGLWRHQYANPANESDSGDRIVGNADTFRLQWFGGVGPSRMPDRHLRGPAPLATESAMIIHGDGRLIGVDPANGIERWQLPLPKNSMRYVMPYDAAYSCLTRDGKTLFIAAGDEIWSIDSHSGEVTDRFNTPDDASDLRWGYLAELNDAIFASLMKPAAPRFSQDRKVLRESFVTKDYESSRPLVCGRELCRIEKSGKLSWRYRPKGVIVHGSISMSSTHGRMVFIEGRSADCIEHETDQIRAEALLNDGYLVCLDMKTGNIIWEQPFEWKNAKNILYSQYVDNVITLVTSASEAGAANYQIRALKSADGSLIWETAHKHVRRGLGHGEQVHHPVALRQQSGQKLLVVEPYLYDLQNGERIVPEGAPANWSLNRPGHSCGTLSGSGHCLFFRANNPTVLNLSKAREDPFTKLSPSRPSCWINIIPAGGRLLIPEGSASCVCSYSLQTSMAFVPIEKAHAQRALPFLEDVLEFDIQQETVELMYGWKFRDELAGKTTVGPTAGDYELQASQPLKLETRQAKFDGKQWLAIDLKQAKLPEMPATVSLEASAFIDEGNPTWTGLITALQDNGSYERGCAIGIHKNRFFFAVTSESTGRLTYLTADTPVVAGRYYHVFGTYDGKLMKLFLNGKPVAVSSKQRGALLSDERSWLAVGAYKDDNEFYPLRGRIREANLYRGCVTEDAVRQKWQAFLKEITPLQEQQVTQ